ncbi:MAG: hypothetical protein RLN77_10790 [Rhodospirillales bacterium]
MAEQGAPDVMDRILDLAADTAKRSLLTAAIALIGALVTSCAAAFAGAAVYMWLSHHLPDYLAALCVAGALLAVGVCLLIRGRKAPLAAPRQDRRPYRSGDPIAELVVRAATTARSGATSHPSLALLSATALGFLTGCLAPRGKQ